MATEATMKSRQHTLVIAEAGVNHNGNIDIAKKLVNAATEAGADVIKFQTFQAGGLVTAHAEQAAYQKKALKNTEGQMKMLKKLELSPEQHDELIRHCEERKIEFLSTPFDIASIGLLASRNPRRWKISSGEITNLPFLREIGKQGQQVILSTGMASLGEIEAALMVLEKSGTHRNKITVLHCTTEYPAPVEEVNLRAMKTIGTCFDVEVGYSDHTCGIVIPIAAVAMGARVIEKHITLDRTMEGPDHSSSLEPEQFTAMVQGVRAIELAMGDAVKRPTPSELANLPIVRKSLVAAEPIEAGEVFTAKNITAKRPGTGISPMHWDAIIGRTATRRYCYDEPIEW
jgi:N,N'-diacetyllegionaminate synthase